MVVANISELVKSARAAHEQHEKSVAAAKRVAARVQAETGYGRAADQDAAGGASS